ncbi:hypothetical protein N7468_000940 [Penicillium chermesinum]|uniref:HTH CENPB-type domain-containing protein n=1 Tax=Penicillium chermesinum TaxID=63820 RepID=A0A9W9PGQ9_9EURO|nr:uncharacterized protein N7468_000940 [Penicillium chermesinum]KAJ5245957.1 hypothetical protein N7468_000940 [Penicillium chermesinum]
MPPKRPRIRIHSKEGRLDLAVNAVRDNEVASIREAARIHEVSESTLRNRLRGVKPRSETRPNCCKLTLDEEEWLRKWVLGSHLCGLFPRQSQIRDMANVLLTVRGSSTTTTVGINWVSNFMKRHSELRESASRRHDYPKPQKGSRMFIGDHIESVSREMLAQVRSGAETGEELLEVVDIIAKAHELQMLQLRVIRDELLKCTTGRQGKNARDQRL